MVGPAIVGPCKVVLVKSSKSKVQATILPAISVHCEMENREQQYWFLQPIQNNGRQGERIFLKAKVPANLILTDKFFGLLD